MVFSIVIPTNTKVKKAHGHSQPRSMSMNFRQRVSWQKYLKVFMDKKKIYVFLRDIKCSLQHTSRLWYLMSRYPHFISRLEVLQYKIHSTSFSLEYWHFIYGTLVRPKALNVIIIIGANEWYKICVTRVNADQDPSIHLYMPISKAGTIRFGYCTVRDGL